MKRFAYLTAVLLFIVPLQAQAPKDWLLRADRSTSAADPDAPGAIKFTAQGAGFHAVTPQAPGLRREPQRVLRREVQAHVVRVAVANSLGPQRLDRLAEALGENLEENNE